MCHVDRHIHVPVLVELYNDSYWVTHHCDRDIIENSDYFWSFFFRMAKDIYSLSLFHICQNEGIFSLWFVPTKVIFKQVFAKTFLLWQFCRMSIAISLSRLGIVFIMYFVWCHITLKDQRNIEDISHSTRYISNDWLIDWLIDFWCFNATFSNISAISWRPVLVVEEVGENHRPWVSNW
jgi:hypothetical protein